MQAYELKLFPGRSLHLCAFEHVANISELRDKLNTKKFQFAILNPELIVSEFAILVAAVNVLQVQAEGRMHTSDVHSELVLTLAANKNILPSLRKFGLNEHMTSLIVAAFDATPQLLTEIQTLIHGTQTSVSSLLFNVTNTKKILQVR
jgi:tRNA threonylcarbamoyladenosine modification (KEOPS) complex Cgi121 subunit